MALKLYLSRLNS